MPLTKQHLQNTYNLTIEEVDATLKAGGLESERAEYTESEIRSSFEVIRQYFDQNLVSDYQQAAELFQQASSSNTKQNKKAGTSGKKSVNTGDSTNTEDKLFSLVELLSYVTQKTGRSFSLADAAKTLHLCGLPEKDNYTQQECDHVLEVYSMMLMQPTSLGNVSNQISSSTVAAEEGIIELVDALTAQRAKNIGTLVNQTYLKNVVKELASSQEDIKNFYAGLEAEILEQIEGKSPAHLILEGRWSEWEERKRTKQLLLSSEKQELPQSESENIISNE